MRLMHRDFLQALLDPAVEVLVDLVGFPSPLRQPGPWDTDWRCLEDHLVYLILGDACLLHTDAGSQRLEPGAWLCYPPGVRFRWTLADQNGTALIERFRLRLRRGLTPVILGPTPLVLPQAWTLAPAMAAVVQEGEHSADDTGLRQRAHLLLLFSEALRLARADTPDGTVLSPGDRAHLRLFVRRRLPQWPSPADLAKELGFSPDYFSRVFRRSFGLSPRAWLVDERIRCAAASLLESDAPVSVVAEETGYTDLTLFGRHFRAVMGQPPRAWRDQHRTFDAREVG